MIRLSRPIVATLMVAGALVTWVVAPSSAASSKSASAKTYTIGVAAELTGAGAGTYGIPEAAGFKVAEQELKQSGFLGKTSLKFVQSDDQTSPTEAVTLFNQFVQSHDVLVIESSYTSILEALAPFAKQTKTPLIVIGSAGTGTSFPYVSRMTDFHAPMNTLAKYVISNSFQSRVVVILDQTNPALVAISGVFQKDLLADGGSNYAGTVSVLSTNTDFSTTVSQVASLNPTSVLVLTAPAQAGNIISQLKSGGVKAPLLGHPGWSIQVAQLAGSAANGAVFPQPWYPSQLNSVKFVAEYKAANGGTVPSAQAAQAHDTVWLIAVAIKRILAEGHKVTGPNIENTLAAASRTKAFQQHALITGFTLNSQGTPSYAGRLVAFVNGAIAPLS